MWEKLSSFVLRRRYFIISILTLVTLFFGYQARNIEMGYEMGETIPKSDSTVQVFEKFKEKFGKDGSIMVLGIKDSNLYQLDNFNAWLQLTDSLKIVDGVRNVVSINSIFSLKKITDQKKFEPERVFKTLPTTQDELDSLLRVVYSLPFFEGFIYSDDHKSTLIALTIDQDVLDSKNRAALMDGILNPAKQFEETTGLSIHYSGLPHIRANNTTKISEEISLFIILAILITAAILILFFRSFRSMVNSMLIVGVGVVWALGIQVLFGFKISILTALIPPLMIVIGIPNCIFILNKYHQEYKNHGNQILALIRVISKIGNAIFLANVTTSLGFGNFMFTNSKILVEFGIVATLGIASIFIISVTLLPIILSFQAPPKKRHTKHLERQWTNLVISQIITIVTKYRTAVFSVIFILIVISIYGVTKIKTTGSITDDVPHHDPVYLDLKFFENNFHGVMPFEITIDTKKKNGALNLRNLQKAEQLQELVASYDEFSKPLSIVEGLKFAKQAYYGGNPERYELFNRQEQSFILPYLTSDDDGTAQELLRSYLDSNKQTMRLTAQVADVGSTKMKEIIANIKPKIDSIFPTDKYEVHLTGTSVVWLRGTDYLIYNLSTSLSLAIIMIAIIMSILFYSARMVIVSLIPNLLPLLFTAGLMGHFGIPIKPSTIIVFGIVFGISVDDTIHYLAKYRQELSKHSLNLYEACINALKETGVSMIYTSIILFFGFGIFTASEFGGTFALGLLISITLLVAMATNLLLLPSMLLFFDKWLTTKAFKSEPLIVILSEEDDIDLEELHLEKRS